MFPNIFKKIFIFTHQKKFSGLKYFFENFSVSINNLIFFKPTLQLEYIFLIIQTNDLVSSKREIKYSLPELSNLYSCGYQESKAYACTLHNVIFGL